MRLGQAFLGCRLLTRSHHREGRLPFRLLFLLAHLDRHGDGPDVAEGILELDVPLSPELVLQWEGWLRAGVQGLVPKFVDIFRVDVEVHRRRTRRGRGFRIAARKLVGHHDDRIADPDRGVHDGAVRHRRPVDLLRAERPFVELDRLRRSVDHQVRRHGPLPCGIGGARRRPRPGCAFRFRSRRRSLCSSSHWKTPRGAKRIRRLRMTHGTPERTSRPSQRPMRTSSTYAPRIRTWLRRTPSSTKPRDSYNRRARAFVAKTASSAFSKPWARILEWMRAQGFEKAELAVFATNARARRLYESLGFVEEGVRRSHVRIRGAYVDEVLMGIWLGREVRSGVP